MRFASFVVFLGTVGAAVLSAQSAVLTLEQQEDFLKKAKVTKTKAARGGITGSLQATLSDGTLTHDAQIQSIDEAKSRFEGSRGVEMNFRDTYKFNIAGYRLAKLLGIRTVPPSVERTYEGKSSAFSWWVDDVLMEEGTRLKKKLTAPDAERWNDQMYVVRVFDQLIYNTDRNLGNLLITKDWTIWMIDHSRAFRMSHTLLTEKNLAKCERHLLEAMKKLDMPTLQAAFGIYVTKPEIEGLLKRRDRIVSFFDKAGEASLYTITPWP